MSPSCLPIPTGGQNLHYISSRVALYPATSNASINSLTSFSFNSTHLPCPLGFALAIYELGFLSAFSRRLTRALLLSEIYMVCLLFFNSFMLPLSCFLHLHIFFHGIMKFPILPQSHLRLHFLVHDLDVQFESKPLELP